MHPAIESLISQARRSRASANRTTINTGVVIGLGSRKYTMVDVSPAGNDKFRFPLDPRPTRLRYQRLFEKFQPFPVDRHGGLGYDRLEEVDMEAVKLHDGPQVSADSHSPYHGDGTHIPIKKAASREAWHPGEEVVRHLND